MTRTDGVAGRARSALSGTARSAVSRAAIPFWVAAVVVIGLLVAFVGFGGLNPAAAKPAVIQTGAEARTSLFTVTVLDAELTDAVEEQFLEAEPGETLLVVTVELENMSDRAAGVERAADRVESRMISSRDPLLELDGVAATDIARSWRADGTLREVILQPGVPAEVKIAWPVPDTAATDDAFAEGLARLNVYDATEQTGQVIVSASTITWRRADLSAQIALEAGS